MEGLISRGLIIRFIFSSQVDGPKIGGRSLQSVHVYEEKQQFIDKHSPNKIVEQHNKLK